MLECNSCGLRGAAINLPTMGQRLSDGGDPDKEIDVAELQEWYKKFVVECPSGTLFMHEFKSFFGVADNKEASDYIESMFRAFDKNGVSTNRSCACKLELKSMMQVFFTFCFTCTGQHH